MPPPNKAQPPKTIYCWIRSALNVLLIKAPGDFWVLQTDETGYQVLRFIYQEGEYTVWYQADDPSPYKVYHEETMIDTGDWDVSSFRRNFMDDTVLFRILYL